MALDKLVDSAQLDANLTAVADAIRAKGGGSAQLAFPAGFVSAVNAIQTGREDHTVPKDVDFVDFDGILLYSYTASEFLALSSLPANPSYPGLVAQGWNWTLADAQAYVREYGCLVVGQNYTTDNGKTRIYIDIPSSPSPYTITVYLGEEADNNLKGVVISWGDGTSSTISTEWGSSFPKYTRISHNYSAPGSYLIEIDVPAGQQIGIGYPWSNNGIIGSHVPDGATGAFSANTVRKIEIGDRVIKIYRQAFNAMNNLTSISIPTACNTIDQTIDMELFAFCYSLTGIVFPSGTIGRDRNMFAANLNALKYIAMPKAMTMIQLTGGYAKLRKFTMYAMNPVNSVKNTAVLGRCAELTHFVMPGNYQTIATNTIYNDAVRKVIIPATVTKIETDAFWYSYNCDEYHVLPTTPPMLAHTRAFVGIKSGCKIYVPYSADHSILNAYKTASNWSTYASYIVEEDAP